MKRERPPLRALGLHRLAFLLIVVQLVLVVVNVVGFSLLPLSYRWSGLRSTAPAFLLVVIGWGAHVWTPGPRKEWHRADVLMALILLATVSYCLGPLQYVAVALQRPLVDASLAAMDARLGIHVPDIVAWSASYPALVLLLTLAYNSYLPQLGLPLLISGIFKRDRAAMWEFLFNFHVCATITVTCLALWPAESVFTYFGFESLLTQQRFIHQFAALRDGTMSVVDPANLEGLVSMPSLHVAGAAAVTWALRRHRPWFAGSLVLNAALIASTVVLGAHYLIDVIAGLLIFALSACAWRAFNLKALLQDERPAPVPSVSLDVRSSP